MDGCAGLARRAVRLTETLLSAIPVCESKSAVPPLSPLMCARHRLGLAHRLPEGSEAFQMRGHEVGERLPPEKMCSPAAFRCGARVYTDVLAQTKARRVATRHVACLFSAADSGKETCDGAWRNAHLGVPAFAGTSHTRPLPASESTTSFHGRDGLGRNLRAITSSP